MKEQIYTEIEIEAPVQQALNQALKHLAEDIISQNRSTI
jgi:hypothetical protein